MTAPQIRPIETSYHGCRFRSRTEARWAVFFDALGVAWEYEREGYALPSGRYLPDFWLPDLGIWIEIKGREPTDVEQRKALDLSLATSAAVYLLWGVPGSDMAEGGYVVKGQDYWDNYQSWVACDICPAAGLTFMAKIDRLRHTDGWHDGPDRRIDKEHHESADDIRIGLTCGHWIQWDGSRTNQGYPDIHGHRRCRQCPPEAHKGARIERAYYAARSARFGT